MRITTITFATTKALPNYENAKYSITAELDFGEDPNFEKLKKQIDEVHEKLYSPKKIASKMSMNEKQQQAVVDKLTADKKAVTLETIEKYYSITEKQRAIFSKLINSN